MTPDPTPASPDARAAAAAAAALTIEMLRERFGSYRYRPIVASESELKAVVLAPFYLLNGELHIVLTKRTNLVRLQQGQFRDELGKLLGHRSDVLHTRDDHEALAAPAALP